MSTKAIHHLSEADPHLGAFIQRAGVIRLRPDRTRTPFVSLVRAVVSQQLSGKAAGTILQRVLALFPEGRFPTPAEILRVEPDTLRAAGLSRQKAAYVRDLAEKAAGPWRCCSSSAWADRMCCRLMTSACRRALP